MGGRYTYQHLAFPTTQARHVESAARADREDEVTARAEKVKTTAASDSLIADGSAPAVTSAALPDNRAVLPANPLDLTLETDTPSPQATKLGSAALLAAPHVEHSSTLPVASPSTLVRICFVFPSRFALGARRFMHLTQRHASPVC